LTLIIETLIYSLTFTIMEIQINIWIIVGQKIYTMTKLNITHQLILKKIKNELLIKI